MGETHTLAGILGLGFSLGLIHALDADHVAAVSALASHSRSRRKGLGFCLRWSLGHGSILLLLGALVLLVGIVLPDRFGTIAETLVGGLLIVMGGWLLLDLRRQRAHLHFHEHDDLPRHAHWHAHRAGDHDHHHKHGAVLIGALHGTAGSAPLLALIPVAASGSPWLGMLYLTVFGLGVLLSMILFGGLLGLVLERTASAGCRAIERLRGGVAVGSILAGGWLLWGLG